MSTPSIPQGDLHDRIVAVVRQAEKPLTFKAIAKTVKAKEPPCREALDSAVVEKRLYRWPDYRRAQYFWHISPEEKARETVLAVASAHAFSKSDLSREAAKKLPGFSAERLKPVVSALVAEEQLRLVPAFSSTAKLLVGTGNSDAYFNALRAFVEKKILAAGYAPTAFFAGNSSPGEKMAKVKEDAAALILDAVQSLEPVMGVPVSTLRLRNHLPNLAKHEFDAAALEL